MTLGFDRRQELRAALRRDSFLGGAALLRWCVASRLRWRSRPSLQVFAEVWRYSTTRPVPTPYSWLVIAPIKLSLQRGGKFREGMGNGLRLRVTQNEDHMKPKTRKGNQIMKNRNIQFKPTAGLLIPLLLACFAAVFILAPTPARAGDQVPFNGTLSGYVETSEPVDECTIHGHAIIFGNATHLGAFTGTGEFYQDVCRPSKYYLHWQLSLVCGQRRRTLRHFRGISDPDGNTWSVRQP